MTDFARILAVLSAVFLATANSWGNTDCGHELLASTPAPVEFSNQPAVVNEQIRPKWNPNLLSDPRHHNPNDYRYIIRVPDGSSGAQVRADVKKRVLSASLIAKKPSGEKFIGSFSGKGWALILRVPEANMVANLYKDTGVMSVTGSFRSDRTLQDYENRFGFHTPDELIKRSIDWFQKYPSQKPYNELFVRGGESVAEPVTVTGLVNFVGRLTSWETAEQKDALLHQLSQELGVPIISIE